MSYSPQKPLLNISEEVSDSLRSKLPVVALESNVICHGLRYPQNLETALAVEHAVREQGAVPATVWIDEGKIKIGFGNGELEALACSSKSRKAGSADMAVILAEGGRGATSVSASLTAAKLAGIPFFATAGIGGVHRGAQQTFDISSDLFEFTRCPVAVVSAGAKSILDLKLTLEYLETHCVPIISYRTDFFPAFYCVTSGLRSPHRMDEDELIARAVQAHWDIGNQSSVLITAPIDETDAIPVEEVDEILQEALAEVESKAISGNCVTRLLMDRVEQRTGGRAAKANASVMVTTAALAGRLASAYNELV